MQSRLKSLRLFFGLDLEGMADLLCLTVTDLERLERCRDPLAPELAERVARECGVSVAWLGGADVPMHGGRLLELQPWLRAQVAGLTGMRLIQVLTSTTGERIAYALKLLHRMEPDLCRLDCVAGWLGLSPESTELLVQGELNPGAPVVARAAELTGLPERWFRQGVLEETEQGDLV